MGFERRTDPLLPPRKYVGRLARSVLTAAYVVAAMLAVGMIGYHGIAGLDWIDSFENAAMILTGMGPVDRMPTTGAKVFAGCYALISGLGVLTVAGIVMGPVFHRVMHRFHLETDESAEEGTEDSPRPHRAK